MLPKFYKILFYVVLDFHWVSINFSFTCKENLLILLTVTLLLPYHTSLTLHSGCNITTACILFLQMALCKFTVIHLLSMQTIFSEATYIVGPHWGQPGRSDCQTTCARRSFCSVSVFQIYQSRLLKSNPKSPLLPGSLSDNSYQPLPLQPQSSIAEKQAN